jgi:hypothetical protein
MTIFTTILPAITEALSGFIKSKFPDPVEGQKAANEITIALLEKSDKINSAAAEIVKAEAASESWLARSWRPIVMLTFAGLIVARWFGWAAPNLSEDEYLKLWDIVQLGLGGYVVGRSVEKVALPIAQMFKK